MHVLSEFYSITRSLVFGLPGGCDDDTCCCHHIGIANDEYLAIKAKESFDSFCYYGASRLLDCRTSGGFISNLFGYFSLEKL